VEVDKLVTARWIIPVEPAGRVLAEHAIAIDDGRIVAIEPARVADSQFHARTRWDGPEHVLIPGLVNAHTHAPMTLFRGLADDRPLEAWLAEHIWPAEQAWVDTEFVRDGADLAVAEMLSAGVTCFGDMYFFPDSVAAAAVAAGMRAAVGIVVIGFPSAWADDIDAYLAKGLAVHDRYRDEPLVSTVFAPHAPYTVPRSALERVRVLAEELDRPITTHLHETATEVANAIAQHGGRPLRYLQGLGLLSDRLVAVHMTQVDDVDLDLLARHGVHVAHCPRSNLKLASGLCPVAKLLSAGVNVALGTDGAASNNELDLLGEMRTAALLAKAVAGDATVVPAPVALRMATLAGARALGLDARIGSLLPGKDADILGVRLDGVHTQPVYGPLSQLVYAASRGDVDSVWVRGERVVADGAPLRCDRAEVIRRARRWAERIAPGPVA
jgi:5-methylthioadenosine/S-adenosylhomocysteine deaminase